MNEYLAAREGVALFDISDCAKFKISGENALDFLEEICTGNISSLTETKTLNTLICDEEGKIIAIVWLLRDENHYYIHSDSTRRAVIKNWLDLHSSKYGDVMAEDISGLFGCLSVVGPKAIEIPKRLINEDIIGLPYLGFERDKFDEIGCLLCRYGYSGEYEYKFIVDIGLKEKVGAMIEEAGKEYNLLKCDIEIMNLLMMEMKSVNQDKDFLETTTPLQAGLHWMICFRKEKFIGRDALIREKEKNSYPKLIMLVSEKENKFKEKGKVFLGGDNKIGVVVQSKFSPKVQKEIGLAYLDNEYAWSGIEVMVETTSGEIVRAETVSAPLFITKTVTAAREG